MGVRRHSKLNRMKRTFTLLIAAIAFNIGIMAQDSRVATLHHGTNFRAYYGADAFISAYNDASDGDVITLTAGEFNCPDISKAITVRGEGMDLTVLTKLEINFQIPTNSSYSLCLEGLTLKCGGGRNIVISSTGGSATVIISKCCFNELARFKNCNAVVLNSILQKSTASNNSSVTCINSILNEQLSGSTFDIQNCVIGTPIYFTNSSIKNSIVLGVTSLESTNVTSHCLVKEGSSGFADSWYIMVEEPEPDPWGENPVYTLWNDLFTEDYHLTAEATQTYVGTDGTEVGIYGGAYPYDETPDYPLVKSLDVKGIHNGNKLKVDIKVE